MRALACRGEEREPESVKTALEDPRWVEAMRMELNSIKMNNTWSLVERSTCPKKPIGLKWVYKIKRDANGEIIQRKARLVAKGYTQVKGIDYEESFSPTSKFDTIRLMLAMGAGKGWKMKHLDVNSAFLYGELEEDVFVEFPPGFKLKKGENKVLKLKKALYGLKQSAYEWNRRIDGFLEAKGFKRSRCDNALYIKLERGKRLYLNIYVDDILCMGDDEKLINDFVDELSAEFRIKNLGDVTSFLGMELRKKR